jgi:aminoglycoside phosphotransferase (APT) family kinase protein
VKVEIKLCIDLNSDTRRRRLLEADRVRDRLLTYLQNELEDTQIRYKTPPKPLEGGQESYLYTYQLENAPQEHSKRQVLRAYPSYAKNSRAQREGIVQQYLHEKGFPTPKTPFICTDPKPIGRPFIIMEYIEGETIEEYTKHDWNLGTDILIETLQKLHRIDPKPLRKRYKNAGIPENDYTWLCQYTDLAASNVEWINPALEWIKGNEPQHEYSICHGDYHLRNVIVDKGKVRGVVDWVNVCIDDPLRDVASTVVMGMEAGTRFNPVRAADIRIRCDRTLNSYQDRDDFDMLRFQYYKAFKCLLIMLAYEHGVEFYGRFGIIDAIIHLFNELTGERIQHKRG